MTRLRENIKAVLFGPAVVVLVSVVAAVVCGAIWGVVDWLRNFGSGLNPFPYFDNSPIQIQAFRTYPDGSLLGGIESSINWYNATFRGATRFGSGLGMIAGAFVSMGFFSTKSLLCRIATGLACGALIGARAALMLGSGVSLCLIGLLVGAGCAALFMAFCQGPDAVTALPTESLPEPVLLDQAEPVLLDQAANADQENI